MVKGDRRQPGIESFFGNPARLRSFEIPIGRDANIVNSKLQRQGSVLSSNTDDDAGFEEEADDTFNSSMDTSMEVSNFRNSNLTMAVKKITNSQKKNSSKSNNTSNNNNNDNNNNFSNNNSILNENEFLLNKREVPSLKRSSTDLLESIDVGGQARKLPKYKSRTVTNLLSRNTSDTILSEEQLEVIESVVKRRQNVFYTGSAGTGKSVVLRQLVQELRAKYRENVGVTAPTGLAACNIQGQTIFRFLEIGLGKDPVDILVTRIRKNQQKFRKWQLLKVLIIDEISMVNGDLFDKLEEIARKVRQSPRPFGGIQIVCTGDFFQLPPVGNRQNPAKFCFQSKAWSKVIERTIVLKTVFRQQGDTELIDMLNALRLGNLTQDIVTKFQALKRDLVYDDGIEATELFPLREEVCRANEWRLKNLPSDAITFVATDNNASNEASRALLDQLMCEKVITLKEGAQVMNIKNVDEELVNGSLGTVLFFVTPNLYVKILTTYDEIDVNDEQLMSELRLLRHRVGSTEEWSEKHKRVVENVPASRRSKFEALVQYAAQDSKDRLLPVVNFNFNGRYEAKIVPKHEFKLDESKKNANELLPIRIQLPLILAWAMSIHKSQGQTLPRVKIDLNRSFENGQAYVALSRAVDKDNLKVTGFSEHKVKTSEVVRRFYESIGCL